MATRKPTVGGNWKMNTRRADAVELAAAVASGVASLTDAVDVSVFPPFVYLAEVVRVAGDLAVGAQDVYSEPGGAFTGEIAPAMLTDIGVRATLVGHSERRHVIGESDQIVNRKLLAALGEGLEPILCIGETLEQREAGRTDAVNGEQLRAGLAGVSSGDAARITIAYEPVWAIGTGRTASGEDAETAHLAIRATLTDLYDDRLAVATRIQYGGSVKPGNAADLIGMPNVDGFLVGGASLDAGDFLTIVRAAADAS